MMTSLALYCFFCFIFTNVFIDICIATETRIKSLVKLTDMSVGLKTTNTTIYAVSLGRCALNCFHSPQLCCSFYYKRNNKNCTLGFWLFPSNETSTASTDLFSIDSFCNRTDSSDQCARQACDSGSSYSIQVPSQDDLITAGNFCNTTAKFKLMTNGSTSSCVWVSAIPTNYTLAKSDCTSKNGHMYTIKTVDKANILLSIVQSEECCFWIGLDDIDQDGNFKWSDDGSVMDNASLPIPYQDQVSSEPDNCMFYYTQYRHLDDYNCNYGFNYICEMYPRCLKP